MFYKNVGMFSNNWPDINYIKKIIEFNILPYLIFALG